MVREEILELDEYHRLKALHDYEESIKEETFVIGDIVKIHVDYCGEEACFFGEVVEVDFVNQECLIRDADGTEEYFSFGELSK